MIPIILDSSGEPLASAEDFVEFKESMRWFETSTFELQLHVGTIAAEHVVRGNYVWARGADEVYLIEQTWDASDVEDPSVIIRKAEGSLAGMFGERLAIPAVDSAYDRLTAPAESLMKHYVDVNAGPSAAVERQVPNLEVIADAAGGASFTISARFNILAHLLGNIGQLSGMGWTTRYNTTSKAFEFDTIVGVDRSNEVVFSEEFANIRERGYMQSDVGRKTFAWIGGQGEGVDREIIQGFIEALEPEGLARRELFVDARDIDPAESAAGALADRGEEKLKEAQPEDTIEISIDPHGNFIFGEDYNLGDIVGIRDDKVGYQTQVRIVEAERLTTAEEESLKLSIARPFPTLLDASRAQASTAGSRAGDGAVIDYPKIEHAHTIPEKLATDPFDDYPLGTSFFAYSSSATWYFAHGTVLTSLAIGSDSTKRGVQINFDGANDWPRLAMRRWISGSSSWGSWGEIMAGEMPHNFFAGTVPLASYPLGHSFFGISGGGVSGWPEASGLVDTFKASTDYNRQTFTSMATSPPNMLVRRWIVSTSAWSGWRTM